MPGDLVDEWNLTPGTVSEELRVDQPGYFGMSWLVADDRYQDEVRFAGMRSRITRHLNDNASEILYGATTPSWTSCGPPRQRARSAPRSGTTSSCMRATTSSAGRTLPRRSRSG